MNIALAVTAARQGATIANHVRVKNLIKDENGKICGLILRDELTGELNNKQENGHNEKIQNGK